MRISTFSAVLSSIFLILILPLSLAFKTLSIRLEVVVLKGISVMTKVLLSNCEMRARTRTREPRSPSLTQVQAMNTFADLLMDRLRDDVRDTHANVTRMVKCTVEHLTALEEGHLEPVYAMTTHVRAEMKIAFTTADSGADTCVFGIGYVIPVQTARLGRNILGIAKASMDCGQWKGA